MNKRSRHLTRRVLAPVTALLASMALFVPVAGANGIEAQASFNTVISNHSFAQSNGIAALNGFSVEAPAGGKICLEIFRIVDESTVPKKCGAGYVGSYTNNESGWDNVSVATAWNESGTSQRLIGTKWVKYDTLASGNNSGYIWTNKGGTLTAGNRIDSANLRFYFVMQSDGNAVVYNRETGKACWWTNTNGHPGSYAYMQPDGNFVIYGGGGSPAWFNTGTNGHASAHMKMQNDGNLVIYEGSTPLWASSWITGQLGC